jgi:hypothetical protein
MAKFTVDVSQIQPRGGIPVTKASTEHPAFRDMPVARGSAFASVPPPSQNVHVAPEMLASVRGLPPDTPHLDCAPLPPASVYQKPTKVASKGPLPDWLA